MIAVPALSASAATSTPSTSSESAAPGTTKLVNPLGVESVPALVNNIITTVLGFVGAIALLMFIYGGLLWLTSRGAADKVTRGKEVMVWAVIGLVVILSSYALVQFVFGAFSRS